MNLNFDFSAVSRLFGGLVNDLRQKKLWPVAVLLLAAIVAVPILLSKSSSPAPQPQAQAPVTPPPSGKSFPALNVRTTPSYSHLTGKGHNPFGSSTSSASGSTTSPTTAASSAVSNAASTALNSLSGGSGSSTATGSSSTSGGASTGSSPSTGGSTAPSSNPPSITGNAKPKPAPSGLKSTQAYDVSLAITDASGGINTTDPLKRLSAIPSDQQPMLVELGVEQGGKRVLFAVQPGTILAGPGTCTPGPIDCEILSLGQDQTEQLSAQTGSIVPSRVALFAITGISAANYPSAAAADHARRAASAAGRSLLAKSNYPALSLFQYEPSLGSVVDLRNLRVGG